MAATSGLNLDILDKTVKPDEDFYQFCNGNWKDEIPADKSQWGSFQETRESTLKELKSLVESIANVSEVDVSSPAGKVALFWKSSMDLKKIEQDGLKPIEHLFEAINLLNTKNEVVNLVAQFSRYGINLLFGCGPESDLKDSNSTILWIGEGGLGLPSREYYFDEDKEEKRKKYVLHIAKVFELAGFKDCDEAAKSVYNFELALAEVSKTQIELRDIPSMYNPRTVGELPEKWDWDQYFKIAGLHCLNIEETKQLCLTNPKFLDFVCTTVWDMDNEEKLNQFKHYARWHVINGFSHYLPKAFENASFEFFNKELNGQTEIEDRWKRMVSSLNSNAGELIGEVYCEKYFPESSKKKMLELVKNVLAALKDMITEVEWMDDSTRKMALKKLSSYKVKIGYPDKFIDYSNFKPSETDSIVSIIIKIREFEHMRSWKEANKPTDPEKWELPPQTVNAYYHPLKNEIVFPAAILQDPAFNPDRDICVNYGAIAAVIGHEATHGFDDQGKQFDNEGNMVNWWTERDNETFKKRKQPIIDHFSTIEVLQGKNVNGELTQGENIADIGGLKCAYRALQMALEAHPEANVTLDGFTPAQRFFMSWTQFWKTKSRDDHLLKQIATDVHSPGSVRGREAVKHVIEFYTAFNVTEESKMFLKPELRGQVW